MCLWKILHDFCGFVTKILLEMLGFCDRLLYLGKNLHAFCGVGTKNLLVCE